MKIKSNISLEATPIKDTDVANCKYVKDAIDTSNVIEDYTSSLVTTHCVLDMWSTSFMKVGNIVFANINITVNESSTCKVELGTLPESIIPIYDQCINTVTNLGVPCYVWIGKDSTFGFSKRYKTDTWSSGDGVRTNIIYLAKNTET